MGPTFQTFVGPESNAAIAAFENNRDRFSSDQVLITERSVLCGVKLTFNAGTTVAGVTLVFTDVRFSGGIFHFTPHANMWRRRTRHVRHVLNKLGGKL